jgi:hypothetical protein
MISVLSFFLYPAYFLQSKFYENEKIALSFDQEVGRLDGLRKDYISALFKVSHLSACSESSIGAMLMNELNHVKNQTDDVFNHLLIDHVSIECRVRALR